MASEVLVSISRDEAERTRLLSEYKYVVDLQSKVVQAQREIARKMKTRGRPFEEIAEDTGLSLEEITRL